MTRKGLDVARPKRFIIDSNYMRNPELRTFLSNNASNVAVLTDYASMEAYKGKTLTTLFNSMEILSEFPRQVLILKGTKAVGQLSGRQSGLASRLISIPYTKDFSHFCKLLPLALNGNKALEAQLLETGQIANQHLERMLGDAREILPSFAEVAQNFTQAEIAIIRSAKQPYTAEMTKKIIDFIMELGLRFIEIHPNGVRRPRRAEMLNMFLFRMAMCAFILIRTWIRNGNGMEVKPEKIRNDVVDINFATYALYFDGILSNDKKLLDIYSEANFLLPRLKNAISP
jgi:hypothetical protein